MHYVHYLVACTPPVRDHISRSANIDPLQCYAVMASMSVVLVKVGQAADGEGEAMAEWIARRRWGTLHTWTSWTYMDNTVVDW